MSYSTTPNLGLKKPTPGADDDQWGTHWNDNATILDTAFGSTSAVNVLDHGARGDGVTDDAAAFNAAIAAALAKTTGGKVFIPDGKYALGSAITATIPSGKMLTLEGVGCSATLLLFTNATDGLNFTLASSGPCGSIDLHGFAVIRVPASPVRANTGLRIGVAPGPMYSGAVILRDLLVCGVGYMASRTNQWNKSVVLVGTSGAYIENVVMGAPDGTATDAGDVLLTIMGGANSGQFTASVNVVGCYIQGGSVGLLVVGFVQGVFIVNSTIIGQYDGIRCEGVAAPVNHTTNAATASGAVLHFASGSLGGVVTGDVVNGANIPPQSRVASVDNAAGTVTMNGSVTGGGVASGAVVAIQLNYVAEDLGIVNCTLNATHRGVYVIWGSMVRVNGNTILHFPPPASDWAAIELNESNNDAVIGNHIIGSNTGVENGIVFSSTGPLGATNSSCIGNTVTNQNGKCIWLKGTTSATTVTGNGLVYGNASVVQDTLGGAVFGNIWNGVSDITTNAAGTKTIIRNLTLSNIPTAATGLTAGDVWRNGTVLNIV